MTLLVGSVAITVLCLAFFAWAYMDRDHER